MLLVVPIRLQEGSGDVTASTVANAAFMLGRQMGNLPLPDILHALREVAEGRLTYAGDSAARTNVLGDWVNHINEAVACERTVAALLLPSYESAARLLAEAAE